jgi:HPt (histidine-containing phosphotransfer) domain-containing protein
MSDYDQHFDLEVLKELKEVMGDEFSLLVDTFVNDSALRITAINEAVSAGNSVGIRRAAHSFKGSASNMGAVHLAKLCGSMEERGRTGEIEGVEQLAKEISDYYKKVEQALAQV